MRNTVSAAIRTSAVTSLIYKLDQNSEVRTCLVELQRRFGERQATVAEGRDIGTVVFPKSHCKIYLDATLEERTERRALQLEAGGTTVDREELRRQVAERDHQSMTRADSPLRQAEDAIYVDSTKLSLEETIDTIVRLAQERL